MGGMDRWTIDELAFAGPEHLDPRFVAGYDRKQGHPDPEEDLSALAAAGVSRASTVVDLGAGTGAFALVAARQFKSVVAVDASPAMVRFLGEQAAADGLDNLHCVEAGFLTFEWAEPVAAVFTRNALHHLPDFWKALALERISRMLRPGGVLRLRDIIYDFEPAEAPTVFSGWLAGASEDPRIGYTADDLSQHIKSEFSTFRWLLEPMLEAAGFEIVTSTFRSRVFGAYTCVRVPARDIRPR
jgi:SAM-dependent methyltransferase